MAQFWSAALQSGEGLERTVFLELLGQEASKAMLTPSTKKKGEKG